MQDINFLFLLTNLNIYLPNGTIYVVLVFFLLVYSKIL